MSWHCRSFTGAAPARFLSDSRPVRLSGGENVASYE
jgi:hypothetical protein